MRSRSSSSTKAFDSFIRAKMGEEIHFIPCWNQKMGRKLTPACRAHGSEGCATYLLPVLLQRWHGWEVAGVMDELKFLKDAVVRQDIHADASAESEREGKGGEYKKKKRGEEKKQQKDPPENAPASSLMISHTSTSTSFILVRLVRIKSAVQRLNAEQLESLYLPA